MTVLKHQHISLERFYMLNFRQKYRATSYILLAAIEADRLNIGTELTIKRSSCSINKSNVATVFISKIVHNSISILPCGEAWNKSE